MRIRRIALRNFGGVGQSDVTFPIDGVTVIEGENEAGKSTLLRALDAIVEYADNSTSRKIRDLVPVGRDVGPEVEVEIDTGDYAFTYRKRWVRDRLTELDITRPVHEQVTGRDAHDRVTQILDDTLDADLWKALRLDQGTALEQASFTGSALGRALDAATGGDVAGDHEDALWDRVEAEYARYWTKTGKERDDLASAKRAYESARDVAETARAHLQSLDEDSAKVERLTLQAESLGKAVIEADNAVDELEKQVEETTKIRHSLTAAVAERDRSIAALGSAHSEHVRRTEQVELLALALAALATIEAEATGAAPERSLLNQDVADADRAATTARLTWEDAQRTYERARQDSEFRRWQIEVGQFQDRRRRVDAARKELAGAVQTIEAISVDDELLSEIESAYLRVVELRATVDSALPVVSVNAMRDLSVVIDGTEVHLTQGVSREITMRGRTEVVIPDTAGFVVTAGTDGADVVEELHQAETAFAALCERGRVSGFEEARAQVDRKTDAERTKSAALETIDRDLADLTFEELVHKFESLTARIDTYLTNRGDEPALPLDHSSAQEVEVRTKETLGEASELSESATDRAAAARKRLNELEKATAGREGKLEIANNAVASARAVLEAARRERSDEAIATSDTDATAAVRAAEHGVSDLEDRLRELDAVTLDALLVNALARRDRSRKDRNELVERRRELEIRLALETERGPARAVDEAETRLVEAERRQEATGRRANAIALLRTTLDTHRSAAHRRYIKPFRDEVERLGRIIFGSTFEVGLAEDLSIDSRTLEGETLAFNQLSTGAQEQLGVLSRLACALLVSDDGGVPVVLDDALGWTDPGRLDRMGAAISIAADDCQVIILTCVPDRYAAVGKARTIQV